MNKPIQLKARTQATYMLNRLINYQWFVQYRYDNGKCVIHFLNILLKFSARKIIVPDPENSVFLFLSNNALRSSSLSTSRHFART